MKTNKINIFATIAIIIVFLFILGKCSNTETYIPDDWRCWYCSKVIRADGKNIHCTETWIGDGKMTVTCDYCGKKNAIQEDK